METRDQKYMDRTEVEAAIEYAEIAASHDVPVTLFLTGRTAVEEPDRVEYLASMDNVEIGGHNYWAFNTPIHTAWRAVGKLSNDYVGSWNGPQSFQRFEIRKTIDVLNDRGADVTAWRDHAYRHDEHTAKLLAEAGITHFSDILGPNERVRRNKGVINVPINTPPDHEHVYHAFRTPGSEAVKQFEGPFGGKAMEVDEWIDWVKKMCETLRESDRVATVLAHPACLWLADEFDSFRRLVKDLDSITENSLGSVTSVSKPPSA